MSGKPGSLIETEKFLRENYSGIAKGEVENAITAMESFLAIASSKEKPLHLILAEVAKTIHRTFDFQYVDIAIRDRRDGLYKYQIAIGLTPEAEKALLQTTYTASDLFDETNFPSTSVSNFTRFYMQESAPFKPVEIATYARPKMLTQARKSPDDMMEGDYINIFVHGRMREILGYIEVGTTRSGKLPSKNTIRWLELMASLLGTIIT